jgi:Fur family peroxide stress response transcriptional regulator
MENGKLSQKHLEQFQQLCNEAGIKLTHQRLEIYRELMSACDHPSAELIHKRIHKKLPTIAIDTVYRTLTTFDELGLVKKLHIMNERTLFDTNVTVHHHFICTHCKKVEDIYWSDFDNSVLPDVVGCMGKIESRHLEIHGVCNDCLNKKVKK